MLEQVQNIKDNFKNVDEITIKNGNVQIIFNSGKIEVFQLLGNFWKDSLIKTDAEYNYDKRRCSHCSGTGLDVFNKEKKCPNCSSNLLIRK